MQNGLCLLEYWLGAVSKRVSAMLRVIVSSLRPPLPMSYDTV